MSYLQVKDRVLTHSENLEFDLKKEFQKKIFSWKNHEILFQSINPHNFQYQNKLCRIYSLSLVFLS